MSDIPKMGLLLGGLGAALVLILGLINTITAPAIIRAQEGIEKRARKQVFPNVEFSPQKVYIIEKSTANAYQLFNEIVKPDNFDKLSQKNTIEFVVLNKGEELIITDRKDLKAKPLSITKEQFEQLDKQKIKMISYHEAHDSSAKNVLKGWVVKYSASGGYSGNIGMLIGFDTDQKVTGYRMVDHSETPGLGVKADEPAFIDAFRGKDPKKMPKAKQDYKAVLGIDSISGATITSLAVSNGVREAFEKLNIKKGSGQEDLKSSNSSEKKTDSKTADSKTDTKTPDQSAKSTSPTEPDKKTNQTTKTAKPAETPKAAPKPKPVVKPIPPKPKPPKPKVHVIIEEVEEEAKPQPKSIEDSLFKE